LHDFKYSKSFEKDQHLCYIILMNICIFTTVCIDHNVSENATYTSAGSPAIFLNKIFKQFDDCSVSIVSSYGADFTKYLGDSVNIFPLKPNVSKTLVYENVSKAGLRTQKAFNRDQAIAVDLDDSIINVLHEADIVFFAPLLPTFGKDYVSSVVANLNSSVLKILIPQGFYREFDAKDNVLVREFIEAKDLLPLMDILFVSEHDSLGMIAEAKEWALSSNLISVVTLGEKGAVAFKDKTEIMFPTIPVPANEIIDSVGSGEVFAAAFVYKYKKIGNLEEAGKFANAVARQKLFYKSNNIKLDLKNL